jgi:succinate---hydroxymethylglutarate CoA-transferase
MAGEGRIRDVERRAEKMSLYFSSVNRNKRSITLNLKSLKAVEIAQRVVAESDGHSQLRPRRGRENGPRLRRPQVLNKRLIYAAVSGYGSSGLNQARSGYDGIALGETGILHITGEPNGRPTKPGVAIIAICTGLFIDGAVLAALAQRQRIGERIKIEGSLFETGLNLLINVGVNALNLDTKEPAEARRCGQPWGLEHPSLVPYGGFETMDERFIFIAGNNNRQWNILCEKLRSSATSQRRLPS